MKRGILAYLGVLLLLVTNTGMLGAEEAAKEVGNKICPVSGESVDEMGKPHQYEYNGKIYNLCCKMCLKDFKNNPEKFSKMAEEEAANSMPGEEEHAGHDHY